MDTRLVTLLAVDWKGFAGLAKEGSPAALYRRMFVQGSPAETNARLHDLQEGRSILDFVNESARQLQKDLGGSDRARLDQYFTSVRDLETRLREAAGTGASGGGSCPGRRCSSPVSSRARVSAATGLTRWKSKPASSAAIRSEACPQPVIATSGIGAVAGSARRRRATS